MYTHIGERKTCISVSIAYLFRRHEINRSYLWSLQLHEVLKVVAAGFQTFKCTANYHLGKVCYLNTCWRCTQNGSECLSFHCGAVTTPSAVVLTSVKPSAAAVCLICQLSVWLVHVKCKTQKFVWSSSVFFFVWFSAAPWCKSSESGNVPSAASKYFLCEESQKIIIWLIKLQLFLMGHLVLFRHFNRFK